MGDLTKDFSRHEFACRDNCGFDDINLMLVERLQMIRNAINEPIKIKSGCRCRKHNEEVGGSKTSSHLGGYAADIECPDSGFRYRFLKQAFKLFQRIEVPNGPWIHVDIDPDKPQEVCFTK